MTNNSSQMKDLLSQIKERAGQRFNNITNSDQIEKILELANADLNDCSVIFLKRAANPGAGSRTLLVAALPNKEALPSATRWAAEVRANLPEPETADLFLFLIIGNVSDDIAARVEADEQFCRKYVVRPTEKITDMLDRSFLAPVYAPSQIATPGAAPATALSDPLAKAFTATMQTHAWFNEHHQQTWRAALLSGVGGPEIVELLLASSGANEITL